MNMNITGKQSSSRFLNEIKSSGTVTIDGLYFSDFNVTRFGDRIEGFFAKLDLNYFVEARLYIDSLLHATVTSSGCSIFGEYRELPFFGTNFLWLVSPFSPCMIRLVYNKNCLQHAKLFIIYNLDPFNDRSAMLEKLAKESVTIPSHLSITGEELVLKTDGHTTDGHTTISTVLDTWFKSPDRKTMHWYPTFKKSGSNEYTFEVPHLGILNTIEIRGDSARDTDLKVSMFGNDLPLAENCSWHTISSKHDGIQFQLFGDHELETISCPYTTFKIVVYSTGEPYMKLEFVHDPSFPLNFNYNKEVKIANNTLVYAGGTVGWRSSK